MASARRRDLFLRVLEQVRQHYRFVVVWDTWSCPSTFTISNVPTRHGHNMKFRLSNLYVRLGSAPTETNNFVSIETRVASALIRVAACAEEFYVALAFYMEVSAAMGRATDSCWFELQRTKGRLPNEIIKGIGMVGYTRHGALYGNIGSDEIRTLINEFWQSDRFRMIGTSRIPGTTAVELAIALDQNLHDTVDTLPENVMFLLERQYFSDEPFLVLLVDNRLLNSTRELLSRAAAHFQHPLLEVGPGAWPPT
ncbi:MAG TPA: hypothetical protein VFA76_17900 [Terriglobales bacterium]|nr:hypothetical protein [Terriglobales bacterium]